MLYQFQCQKEGSLFYYQHGSTHTPHFIRYCPLCGSSRVEPTGQTFKDVNECKSVVNRTKERGNDPRN